MHLADHLGLPTIADRIAHYAQVRGNRFGYWTPSSLLTSLASSKQTLAGWKPR
jgi:3-hydroxyacyl-CoA dehydrogenase